MATERLASGERVEQLQGGLMVLDLPGRWSVSFKFEPRDLWIGVFCKRERNYWLRPGLHVYVCPLPTMLFHFVRMDVWKGCHDG
jgi:hypothetical protein